MSAIRRRIHVIAIAWLFCQVASLSAFVPGECCKSHAAQAEAKAKQAACHESPASAEATAGKATAPKDGDACPMHHGQKKSHSCCTMSNGCDGPGQQLTALFAYVGVLESLQSATTVIDSTAAYLPDQAPLIYRLSTPDAPPPKV